MAPKVKRARIEWDPLEELIYEEMLELMSGDNAELTQDIEMTIV
jgi:hypothetical protein